ncbi:MAG: SBBP repeat-containing protein [Limisphaerales bacterium]
MTKLSPDGSHLLYSTYLGGSLDERASGIAVDPAGNAYLAGLTPSLDFPITNSLQQSNAGSGDAFVAKLNTNGSALVYATYLGGSGVDGATGIAADKAGNAYVTGYTFSPSNFPTVNAWQTQSGGSGDAFVAKLGPQGTNLLYCTYLGGSDSELAGMVFMGYDVTGDQILAPVTGIAVDDSGNAFVTGETQSSDFPTVNALKATNTVSSADAFVVKLSSVGAPLYSTYLGGMDTDVGHAIAMDQSGNT